MEISVIIPSFNRPEWSVRAIQSVINQTYKNWNLIFIDDGSTDNTYERVSKYLSGQSNISYTIVKNPNLGVSHARNTGIKLSTSPYVSFLDCDDQWFPHKLETQVNFLKANPNFNWVYTEERWLKNNQPFTKKKQHIKYDTNIFQNCVHRCFIGASTVLINKSIFQDIGLFNESFPVCEDYELWLRIANKYPIGFINDELIIKHGGHADQLSTQYKAMDYWRVKASAAMLSSKLDTSRSEAIIEFINKKLPILINGFKKYNHPEKLQDILSIRKKIDHFISNSTSL